MKTVTVLKTYSKVVPIEASFYKHKLKCVQLRKRQVLTRKIKTARYYRTQSSFRSRVRTSSVACPLPLALAQRSVTEGLPQPLILTLTNLYSSNKISLFKSSNMQVNALPTHLVLVTTRLLLQVKSVSISFSYIASYSTQILKP